MQTIKYKLRNEIPWFNFKEGKIYETDEFGCITDDDWTLVAPTLFSHCLEKLENN